MANSPEQGAERRNMTNSKRRPRIKQELVMEIDGIFARGRTTAEVRRIGAERRARYDDEHGGLAGGPPLYECSRTMLALAKIGLAMASDEDIRRLALMDPVLFFYVVAMVEEALEKNPGLLLFGGGGPRASDAGPPPIKQQADQAACSGAAGRGRATPAGAQSSSRSTSSSCTSGTQRRT